MTIAILQAIHNERDLSDRILDLLPADEWELALKTGAPREQIESLCETLHKQRKIRVDRRWDWPRGWKRAKRL